jgi:alkanesulfonate monooxygenase SsuD/methylene tetrahydromethanopterin reductase-like flavin-dependent oxidoreductase (luciferase family)
MMKFGLYLPNYGDEVSAMAFAELAAEAENAGWDGFFLWDHILASKNQKLKLVDPWIALTAVAMKTSRLRFGTTVTPIPRRRPWRLARETVTLDQLSGGRLILSVGIGEPADVEFASFGEDPDPRVRGEKLDEGLDILAGLWSGKKFGYQGRHFQIEKVAFRPTPVQSPRIPVWVGGFWPNKAPFRRAARWDGVLPLKKSGGYFLGPEDLRELMAFIGQHRSAETPFDAVIIGSRSGLGKKAAAVKRSLAGLEQAGATWWLQALFIERNSIERLREAISQGPPE